MSDLVHAAGLAALVLVCARMGFAQWQAGLLARRAVVVRSPRPDFAGYRRRGW